jgi:hypothetical protein
MLLGICMKQYRLALQFQKECNLLNTNCFHFLIILFDKQIQSMCILILIAKFEYCLTHL